MKAFIVFTCLIGLSYEVDWTYNAQYRWPGVCSSGTQQSPINIQSRDAVVDRHQAHLRGPLRFRGYNEVTTTALNNGHTLKWSAVPGTQRPVLSGGPLRGNYTFLQFHLHWLSEHAIDGYKYPLEIHMVHIKTGLLLEEALARPDGVTVVGVMCTLTSGTLAEHALAQIIPTLPQLTYRGDPDNQTMAEIIDLTRLLSPDPQSYYTYHGSLTTPDCQESVTWIVMDKPLAISDEQYKLFSKIDIGNNTYNYRGLHPTNRIVYRSMASCASIASPTFVGFLFALITCAKSIMAATLGKGVCVIVNMKRKLFGGTVKECKIVVTAKKTSSRDALNSLYPVSTDPTPHPRPLKLSVEPGVVRSEWRYDNETSWPGRLCREGQGRRQSPINIRTEVVVMDTQREFIRYGALRLQGYQSVLVTGVNNGRTIQFTMEGEEAMHPTVTGGPLRYLYRLEQMHFHWLSEHAVNGYKYPMEIHFVYIRADLSTSEALRKRDGIAIIAAFGNIKSEIENDDHFLAGDMMEEVVRQLPQLNQYGDRVSGIVLNMSKLLPVAEPTYVAYAGSLTSPECNEVVTWIILDNPVFMTYGQYKDFTELAKTRYNFRRLQVSNLTVYRPSTPRFRQPMIFRVFADMYDVVKSFLKNMNSMLKDPTGAKVEYYNGP